MKRKEKDGADLTVETIMREGGTYAIYCNFTPGPDYGNHRALLIGDKTPFEKAPKTIPDDWNNNKEYSFVGIFSF